MKGDTEVQPQQVDDAAKKTREATFIKDWNKRIGDAKKKASNRFDEMRQNMKFARGLQWKGQEALDYDKYVCNIILHALNQRVAQLYARNPECESVRRERLDYELWDGTVEQLQQAMMGAQAGDSASVALLLDYQAGKQWQAMVEKVAKTVSIVAQYMMDSLQPSFKIQMKLLVRRIMTCGVGYVRLHYVREFEQAFSSTETESTVITRGKHLQHLIQKIQKGDLKDEAPEAVEAAATADSLVHSAQNGDTQNINERITFDFPSATAVVVDPRCKNIKGFIGARWVSIEYLQTLDYVKGFFEKPDLDGTKVTLYDGGGKSTDTKPGENSTPMTEPNQTFVLVREVFDITTKSTFVLCDGYNCFLIPPEPVTPETNHFWPIVPFTFNDVESEPDPNSDAITFYPPADVDVMRPMQKEKNRSRDDLRDHRIMNVPGYMVKKGVLSAEDKEKLRGRSLGDVLELESLGSETKPEQLFASLPQIKIDPTMYDTRPVDEDILATTGLQDANFGNPIPRVSATGANIAEQSKNSVASSNVDDLDDGLSELAQMMGETIIRNFDLQTVKRIAGRGAMIPQVNREDFINEIILSTKAASSGRPNKALEIANYKEIAPVLLQAGANPIGVVEEGVKRLGDGLQVDKFFPIMPVQLPQPQPQATAPGDKAGLAQPSEAPHPPPQPA